MINIHIFRKGLMTIALVFNDQGESRVVLGLTRKGAEKRMIRRLEKDAKKFASQ